MKKTKTLYLALILLFTLLLVCDLGVKVFAPTVTFPQNGQWQQPDFETNQQPAFPDPQPASILTGIARYWIPIAAVCAIADAICVLLFLRTRKKNVDAAESASNTMPPLLEPEDDDEPPRAGSQGYWIAALCVVLAIVMIVASLPTAAKDSATVNTRVISGKSEVNSMSTVLSGAGTLTASDAVKAEVPTAIPVEAYHVKNGDIVSEGDILASVDPIAVRTAISQLQTVMTKLDQDLSSEKGKTPSSYISATTSGRVKKIYAEVDRTVSEVVYDNGALLLLSLDGNMAVQLPIQLTIGTQVTVVLSDKTEEKGRVSAYSDGISTITISDKTAPCDDIVTVLDENSTVLGTGKLYVHSPLKVVSYYGTISRVCVSLNQKVSKGSTLLNLKDVGHTAKYFSLLDKRNDLVEQMELLVRLSVDGAIRAESAGIVSGVDSDIDYVPLSASVDSVEYRFVPLVSFDSQYRILLLTDGGDGDLPADGLTGTFVKVEGATLILDGGNVPLACIASVVDKYDSAITLDDLAENDSVSLHVTSDPTKFTLKVNREVVPNKKSGKVIAIDGNKLALDSLDVIVDITDMKDSAGNAIDIKNIDVGDTVTVDLNARTVSVTKAPPKIDITGVVAKVDASGIAVQTAKGIQILTNGGQAVTIDGKPGAFADIKQGNTVKATNSAIIVSTSEISPDAGALDEDALAAMLADAMRGAMGGFSMSRLGGTTAKAAVYDTYDLSKSTVAAVTPLDEMTVSILVDELDILTLHNEMDASITLDAMRGKTFAGKISHINLYGTNQGGNTKYTVDVTLPRTPEMLEGMNASVKIVTAVSDPVPTIPAAALQEINGRTWVYTAYDAKTDTLGGLIEVDTGLSDGKLVEIRSGIDANTPFFYRFADTIEYQFV